jgi:hypothetical protein
MPLTITPKPVSFCTSATEIKVSGSDLTELKKLALAVMEGTNDGVDNDGDGIANENEFGLQEIYDKRRGGDLGTDTIIAAEWLSKPANQALYASLKRFQLAPQVKDCRLPPPPEGKKNACSYIGGSFPASPDFYPNMTKLIKGLSSGEQSLTYYVYGVDMPHCGYFGHHNGILTLNLKDKCD